MNQVIYSRTNCIPLDQLTPFPGNAKRGNVQTILASLRRNGQYRSLVVREIDHGARIVLAGNHTMRALDEHGPGDCAQTVTTAAGEHPCGICGNDSAWEPAARCEIVRCDDDTARRINLVDNRAADLGTYDTDALADLLTDLDDDLDGTGYTTDDLDSLAATLAAPDWERLRDAEDQADPANGRVIRNVPVDAIFSMGRLSSITYAAYEMGFIPGVISTALSAARHLREALPHLRLGFMDNEWHDYDHAAHVAAVAETKPKYATVRDAMTKQQCEDAGVEFIPLPRVLEMAEEVAEHADHVIVIPKYDCLHQIPDRYVLGYSVQTSYGGTPLPITAFRGRRIHLLGGSWANQRRYLALMGDDVVSFDNNHLLRVAEYGKFTFPDGSEGVLAALDERMPRTWQAAAILSLASIRD